MGVRFTHLAMGAAALLPWTVATSAWAQTWAIAIDANTPNLGKVAMPNSASTFTVPPGTGSVTQTGMGVFVSGASASSQVQVSCGNQGACNNTDVKVVIAKVGSPTSPLSALTNFTVAMNGATLVGAAPSPASSITFTLGPIGKNSSKAFYVGMDMPVLSSGSSTGAGSQAWSVVVSTTAGGSSVTNSTGLAKVTSMRPISVSKSLDLSFGTIVKPPSGSGSVTMDASGGFTSMPAGAVPIKTHNAAQFFVFGEGDQTFNLSVTPTFTMVSGVNSLPVTTVASTGSQTLGPTIGMQGSFSLGVGGSFPLGSATPSGAYTGSFTVTATYN